MTSELVQQIWAEVMILADAGEKLYLPTELEAFAKEEQREAMEQDDREGLVRLYYISRREGSARNCQQHGDLVRVLQPEERGFAFHGQLCDSRHHVQTS